MNEIVVLSAGKILNSNLYPFFKNKYQNKLINEYRQNIFKNFDKIYEILGFSKKKIFSNSKKQFNHNWKHEKSCGSFLKFISNYKSEGLFISYSDIIFNETAIKNLKNSKESISFCSSFLPKKSLKKKETITLNKTKYEFLGLVYLKPDVIKFLKDNFEDLYLKFKKKNLSYLIKYLIKLFSNVFYIDGNVQECNNYNDYLNFLFFTKGHALRNFDYSHVKINKFVNFTFNEWKFNKTNILKNINKNFNKNLIVRSSTSSEDNLDYSNAGYYLSIPNIKNTKNKLITAINKVFNSYDKKNNEEFIIVQNMQKFYDSSGVIFSSDIENSSPYYIINDLKKKDGDTSFVTSGKSINEKKITIFKDSKYVDTKYNNLINYLKNVENITGIKNLDCEFALNKNETIIFQIRPLFTKKKYDLPKVKKLLKKETSRLLKYKNKTHSNILMSVMSDWNPAEIIGKNAPPLSIFFYEFLIMKNNWYLQRFQNGYSNLKQKKLSYNIGNTLYIDVVKSFKSLIPREIHQKTKNQLLKNYILILKKDKKLHDKIESDIIISNLSNDSIARLKNFDLKSFEIKKLKNSLKKSNLLIKNLVSKHFHNLDYLNNESIILDKQYRNNFNFKSIKNILDITEKKYILPFAHLARGSFVSKIILKDFFSANEINDIISNIETISSIFNSDITKISSKQFKEKYKHLVPNTYDFNNVLKNNYIRNIKNINKKNYKKINIFKILEKRIKEKDLVNIGFKNHLELFNFIKNSISGREYAKYIFSRNIFLIFNNLRNWAEKNNIEFDYINFINNRIFSQIYKSGFDKKLFLKQVIASKKKYQLNLQLNLPDFIDKFKDLYFFEEFESKATFIGKNCNAEIINFSKDISDVNIYKSKIILIPNADPGFEFLLHLGIKGIITKYGGSNSHMAIRSNELNLTSIIGLGSDYEKIKKFKEIKVNTLNNFFEILK